MLNTFLAGVVLASTMVSPVPVSPVSTTATDSDTVAKPLVRERLGVGYTLHVNEVCPDSHPYVHQDGWVGSLPADVSFISQFWGSRDPEVDRRPTKIWGVMTNWSNSRAEVSLDLICTSNKGKARPPMP